MVKEIGPRLGELRQPPDAFDLAAASYLSTLRERDSSGRDRIMAFRRLQGLVPREIDYSSGRYRISNRNLGVLLSLALAGEVDAALRANRESEEDFRAARFAYTQSLHPKTPEEEILFNRFRQL